MRDRGVKISGWQRFWDAIKPPPPVPKDTLRRHQESQISGWQRLWTSVKPPPKANQPEAAPASPLDRRRRRGMFTISTSVLLLGGAGAGIYYYVDSAPSRADSVLADGMRLATVGKYQDAIARFTRAV